MAEKNINPYNHPSAESIPTEILRPLIPRPRTSTPQTKEASHVTRGLRWSRHDVAQCCVVVVLPVLPSENLSVVLVSWGCCGQRWDVVSEHCRRSDIGAEPFGRLGDDVLYGGKTLCLDITYAAEGGFRGLVWVGMG